jgi:hypothetical protein
MLKKLWTLNYRLPLLSSQFFPTLKWLLKSSLTVLWRNTVKWTFLFYWLEYRFLFHLEISVFLHHLCNKTVILKLYLHGKYLWHLVCCYQSMMLSFVYLKELRGKKHCIEDNIILFKPK